LSEIMASKRKLVVTRSDDEAEKPKEHRGDREIMIDGTWTEWFQKVFLKYCYVVGILFLACMVPLEVIRQLDGDLGLGLAFLTVLVIVPLGFLGYLKLWGSGGVWGSESTDDN